MNFPQESQPDAPFGRDGSPSRPPEATPEATPPAADSAESPDPNPDCLPTGDDLPPPTPPLVPDGPLFFITIKCATQGSNQLARSTVARVIVQNLLRHQDAGFLWVHLLMLMPDHLHGLFSFSREISMPQTILNFKRFTARHSEVTWQRDTFDYQPILDDAAREEKWNYIRHEPVRRKLVKTPDEWQFQWHDGLKQPPEVLQGQTSPSRPPKAKKPKKGKGERRK